MMQLTAEQVRKLAALGRDMDNGKQSYVVVAGERWPFAAEALEDCGCVSGQTVGQDLLMQLWSGALLIAALGDTVEG